MRIVFISDTHNQHRRLILPDGDMLIHAGDISGRGTKKEIEDFLNWFSSMPHKYKIFIAGNHDFFIQENEKEFRAMLPSSIIYLQDELAVIEGIKIYGSPWTPVFMNWAFMKTHGPAMKKQWDLVPDGIDILLTHGPAFGTLDKIFSGLSVGCDELRKVVKRIQPKYLLFGHIHEGYGSSLNGTTKYINGAVLNEKYVLCNAPVLIDLL